MSRCGENVLTREDGGSILEVALGAPVLMLLVLGAMQFSILLFGYCSMSFATRNAVRFASLHSNTSLAPATTASVQATVIQWLWASTGQFTVAVNWPSGNAIGYPVKVTVTQTYNVILPFTAQKQIMMKTVASRSIAR